MRRWFIRFAAVFFLIISIALIVLWVRSYQGPDYFYYTSSDHWFLGVVSGHGTIDMLFIADWQQDPGLRRGRYSADVYYGTRYSDRFLGFGGGLQNNGGRFINVPYWFLLCCALLLTFYFSRQWWRSRRFPSGFCRKCGYDLRASPERCPECGTRTDVEDSHACDGRVEPFPAKTE